MEPTTAVSVPAREASVLVFLAGQAVGALAAAGAWAWLSGGGDDDRL